MEYTACLDLFARATLQASNRGFLYLASRSLSIRKTWGMMKPPRCSEYCRAILLAPLHQSPHAVTSRHLPERAASSLHGCKRTAPELATAPELCKGRLSHLSLRANPLHNPLKLPPEMAWKTLVSGLALAAAIVNALPASSSHIVHERRDSLHPRWLKRDRVPSHKKLPMRIGLTQSNLDQAHDYLMDV